MLWIVLWDGAVQQVAYSKPIFKPNYKHSFAVRSRNRHVRPTSRCSGRRYAAIEIGAILKAGIGPCAFPIYDGGAAERQAVGPCPINAIFHVAHQHKAVQLCNFIVRLA